MTYLNSFAKPNDLFQTSVTPRSYPRKFGIAVKNVLLQGPLYQYQNSWKWRQNVADRPSYFRIYNINNHT